MEMHVTCQVGEFLDDLQRTISDAQLPGVDLLSIKSSSKISLGKTT
jgi:hypothetical protein